jgi:hypothetical protein
MFISDKNKAYRAGQCDGLLGRESQNNYKQQWLAEEYLRGYMAGYDYRRENGITLIVPGITSEAFI